MKKQRFKIVFIALFLVMCLVPSLGMFIAKNDTTSENRVLAEFPSFYTEDKQFNVNYLSQLGDYFNDHFAFRSIIVSLDSFIQSKVFSVSSVDSVIVGTDGWLYYKDTLNNYKGQELLSERAVNNIVHNICMMKDYVELSGSQFLLTVAPNKNTLYGDNMPYYLKSRVSQESDAEKVGSMIKESGVNYTDLFTLFRNQEEVLYFKRDSHWNTMGAHLVYNEIMDNLDREYEDYSDCEIKLEENYLGDLHKMVYPLSENGEEDRYYDYQKNYTVVSPDESPEAYLIVTQNEAEAGSLLMYRDSFGNSLYPIFANAFGSCAFSKATPYNLSLNMLSYTPDVVVVEKVERNLSDFAFYPPVFLSPQVWAPDEYETDKADVTISAELCQTNTQYIELKGFYEDGSVADDGVVYVRLYGDGTEESFYEAFSLSSQESDNGFSLIINKESYHQKEVTAEIFTENDGVYKLIATQKLDLSQIQEELQ
ncbi:MAG: hypothetical protein IJ491_04620 [Clostridia bacterium]|nr:hypothetical protein [Clostridia bacterium]